MIKAFTTTDTLALLLQFTYNTTAHSAEMPMTCVAPNHPAFLRMLLISGWGVRFGRVAIGPNTLLHRLGHRVQCVVQLGILLDCLFASNALLDFVRYSSKLSILVINALFHFEVRGALDMQFFFQHSFAFRIAKSTLLSGFTVSFRANALFLLR